MLLQMGEDLPLEFVDDSNLSHENVDSGEKHYADYTSFSTNDKLPLVHKNHIGQNFYWLIRFKLENNLHLPYL